MSLQLFESANNALISSSLNKLQSGSFSGRLPANTSGRVRVVFQNPFTKLPQVNLSVSSDLILSLHHGLESVSLSDFVFVSENVDLMNEASLSVLWEAKQN